MINGIQAANRRHWPAAGLLAALLGATSGPALAQSAPAATAAANDQPFLAEIVVTARKRAESLQNVPVAVTAIDGETLRAAAITDISDLASRTPSFTFQQQNALEQELFIRGIGTVRLNSATADPSVGVFLDEVYIGRRGTATPPIFDLERVEVLRGPQGTLFGKNVVGGAISFVTARPKEELEGFASVSMGNYGAIASQAYITGALSDTVKARLSFYQNRHDGYATNIVTGQELEDIDSFAGRLSVQFDPNEALSILVVADAGRDSGGGSARHAVDDPTRAGFGFITPNLISDNPRTTETPHDQYMKRRTSGLTVRADYDFDGPVLTYVAAVRRGEASNRWSQPGAGSPPSITDSMLTQTEDYVGITQELRLASAQDQPLRWVSGLYFLKETTDRSSRNTANSFLPGGAGSTRDTLDGDNIFIQTGKAPNYAAFGELEYDLTTDLTLSAGMRYTIDHKSFDSEARILSLGPDGMDNALSPAPLLGPYHIKVDQTWRRLTPRVLLEWSSGNGTMVYGSVTRGFKGGGWQSAAADAATASLAYNPETAWNYEAGIKTDLLDNRMRFNLAAFYTDFKDLQVEQLDDVALTLVVANAASAKIKGLEAEVQVQPTRELTLSASGSLLHARYGKYLDAARNLEFTGNKMLRTPDYQFSVSANYAIDVGSDMRLSTNVAYVYQDNIFWGPENTNVEPGYGLLDARVSLGTTDGAWQFTVYGKNLTDKLYRTSIIPFAGDEVSLYGAPRTYGARLSTRF
ncbi:TonB-dependent receptor [Niveispirillum fermenti]|uniref:TonB-dependent receptor n=1 Tax=Niveispirillum fermenti TaxID=1233113 RepID=UPI003A840094